MATGLGEGKLWIQTFKTLLQIDFVSIPAHTEESADVLRKLLSLFLLWKLHVTTTTITTTTTTTTTTINNNNNDDDDNDNKPVKLW